MKWLITGGCGFLGTSLIRYLLKNRRDDIRIIDNLSVGSRNDLGRVAEFYEVKEPQLLSASFSGVQLIVGDILDSALAVKACNGIDTIVHFAANTGVGPSVENPRNDLLANVAGTFNYLEAARSNRVSRFIFASSNASVGEVEPPIHENLPPKPVSPYGASKLAGEGYCSVYKRTFGVDTVVLRFGNVYGPGSVHKGSVVAKFIRCALNGNALEIYGDGAQTRDFIYIDDLIEAVVLAATASGVGGEIFQIATSRETTVGEMVDLLLTVLRRAEIDQVNVINSEARQGDVRRNFSDTSKAREQLGWQSKVGLELGLKNTLSYFLNNRGCQYVSKLQR